MIMTALKECTRALHEQIEMHVCLLDRLNSLDSYRMLLERFLGYYEPIELKLRMLSFAELDFSSRRKTEKHPILPISVSHPGTWQHCRVARIFLT